VSRQGLTLAGPNCPSFTAQAALAKKPTSSPVEPAPPPKEDWLDKPLTKVATVISVVSSIFGAGYGMATNNTTVQQQMLTMQQQQACNERVAQEQEKCAEYRRSVEAERMQNLTKTVESLREAKLNKP